MTGKVSSANHDSSTLENNGLSRIGVATDVTIIISMTAGKNAEVSTPSDKPF